MGKAEPRSPISAPTRASSNPLSLLDHRADAAEQAARRGALDDRKVLNGIYWRLLLAAAHRLALGRDSERYGPSTTCYNPTTVRPLGLDSSSDPRPAAWCERQKEGGPKKWRPSLGTSLEPLLHGASRGGLTTKIHALVDANGLPILLKLTPLKLWREIVEARNVAAAIFAGAVAIGIALIIAAAMH